MHVAQVDNNRKNLHIILVVKTGDVFFTIYSQIFVGTFQPSRSCFNLSMTL